MSNFLIITNPSPAHNYPLYPIASELVKSGHSVKWISGWVYKEKIENTGAEFIQMHPKYDRGKTELYDFLPELKNLNGIAMLKCYYKKWLLAPVKYYIEQIEDVLLDYKADAIIGDSFRLYAVFVTERGGPSFVMMNVLPLIYPSKDVPPQGMGMLPGKSLFSKIKESVLRFILYKIIFRSGQKYCNKIRSDLGLQKYRQIFIKEGCDRSAAIMQPTVPSFEYYPLSKLPKNIHFIGPVLVKPDPNFVPPSWWKKVVAGDKKVILTTQGTIAKTIDNLIVPTIEAFKNENAIVIAVPVKKNQLTNLPANVFVEEFIPYGNLLPYVDVVITNGGYGGVQNALAHGIPLIIAGTTEDKMEVSARVEYSQSGINLKTNNPTPKEIYEAYKQILSDPTYRNNAQYFQYESKKYDAPRMAVHLLEKLTNSRKKKKYVA